MGSYFSNEMENNAVDYLILMIKSGNVAEVRQCLEAGVPINAPGTLGYNSLAFSIINSHKECFSILMEINGIDPNSKSSDGCTPLMFACRNGECDDMLDELLKRNVKLNEQDNTSLWSALHYAVFHNNIYAVTALLTQTDINVNVVDCSNQSPLHVACVQGHTEIARELLLAGADLHLLDNEGNDALTLCSNEEIRDLVLSYVHNVQQSDDI